MQECHYELIKELIEIEILKKDFYSKQAFANTLSQCKKDMLEGYADAISDLLVGYSHVLHELEGVKDSGVINKRLDYLEKVFRRSAVRHFRKGRITKLYYFFYLFIDTFEKDVLTESNNEILDHFINDFVDTPRVAYERILTKFYSYIELGYLFMSGLQFDCDNIKESVINHSCFNIFKPEKFLKQKICKQDVECRLKILATEHEFIHFFILPEYRDKNFIENTIKILLEVHKHPENIDIIVDYKLHPSFQYEKDNFEKYELARQIFHDINLINCNHIDFGEFKNSLNITAPNYRDAVKDLMQRSRREKKVPLTGEILTSLNKVAHVDMQRALEKQTIEHKPLGELLRNEGLIKKEDIEDSLLIQERCKEDLKGERSSELISSDTVERILKQTSGEGPK